MDIESISIITTSVFSAIAIALITGAVGFAVLEHKGLGFNK